MEKIKENFKKYSTVYIVILLLLVIVGISYAIFAVTNLSDVNTINLGQISMSYTEPENALVLENALPMGDAEGIAQSNYFEFKVMTHATTNADDSNGLTIPYEINLGEIEVDADKQALTKEQIKVYLTKVVSGTEEGVVGPILLSNLSESSTSDLNIYQARDTHRNAGSEITTTYRLRAWIDEDVDSSIFGSQIYQYKFRVNINSSDEASVVNKANSPVLLDNMIPVYYDEEEEVWKKADKANISAKWYDYDAKMWANAVTVSETNRATYLSSPVGTTISMEDINTMWVWIPRYKYTIFNANMSGSEVTSEQEIKIEFESGTSTTGTVRCVDSINNSDGTSETCTDTVYGEVTNGQSTYTHPAFTFGNNELTGFWFGKFENSIDSSNNIIIKPDMLSWNNHTISTAFEYSRKMELQNNIYGFSSTANAYNSTGELSGDTNNFDTHNIKNMEWGAVAYLTQSEYGRCTDGLCTEIYINNSARQDGATWYDTYTGRSGGTVGESVNYKAYGTYSYDDYVISDSNTKGEKVAGRGVGASTTGNIYGIYDMSGGLWDRAMGNMAADGGGFNAAGSGTWSTGLYPSLKYYDRYTYGTTYNDTAAYKRGKLGDATKEILKRSGSDNNGWYSDYSFFPSSVHPWFSRGGHAGSGSSAGVFHFYRLWGSASSHYGSRVSLVALES